MKPSPDMHYTRLTNWFGSAAEQAHRIGPLLKGCALVVVPFVASFSEVPYLDAAKIIVGDKHAHVINLARVMADDVLGEELQRRLAAQPFCQPVLDDARRFCRQVEEQQGLTKNDPALLMFDIFGTTVDVETDAGRLTWAMHYAITSWMGRGGNAGTNGEFSNTKIPIRYSPDGGGSAQRFQNWVSSIPAWRDVLRRCEIDQADAFDVIGNIAKHDTHRVGIYCDPPWVTAGRKYKHPFTDADHRRLAKLLGKFTHARVVIRYGDEPLVRELYPSTEIGGPWTYITYPSRGQQNNDVQEILILNRAAAAKVAA